MSTATQEAPAATEAEKEKVDRAKKPWIGASYNKSASVLPTEDDVVSEWTADDGQHLVLGKDGKLFYRQSAGGKYALLNDEETGAETYTARTARYIAKRWLGIHESKPRGPRLSDEERAERDAKRAQEKAEKQQARFNERLTKAGIDPSTVTGSGENGTYTKEDVNSAISAKKAADKEAAAAAKAEAASNGDASS